MYVYITGYFREKKIKIPSLTVLHKNNMTYSQYMILLLPHISKD